MGITQQIISGEEKKTWSEIKLEDFMIAMISLSYTGDIRNKLFDMEGKSKFEGVYFGNKKEFDSLYLGIVENYFRESVYVGDSNGAKVLRVDHTLFFENVELIGSLRNCKEFYEKKDEPIRGKSFLNFSFRFINKNFHYQSFYLNFVN